MVKGDRLRCPYEDCGRDYLNRCNLNRHIKFHHLKQAFVCPLCQKGLSSRQNLDEHLTSHTGERSYKCPYRGCPDTFRQASQLSLHKKMHRLMNENRCQTVPGLTDMHYLHLLTPGSETFVPPFLQMPVPKVFEQEK